jgi:hypothetical protein
MFVGHEDADAWQVILFGDGNQQVVLPDLNEAAAEEMQTTQIAPTADSCFLP